jgi:DNA segregation ATPase FtsK/SpoIIIE-like protein
MTEPPLDPRERKFLRDVMTLTEERSRTEAQFTVKFTALKTQGEAKSAQWRETIDTHYVQEKAAAESAVEKNRRALANRLGTQRTETQTNADTAKKRALALAKKQIDAAEKRLRETRWEANTIFDAAQHDAVTSLKILNGRLSEDSQTLATLAETAEEYLERSRLGRLKSLPPASLDEPIAPAADPLDGIEESNARSRELLENIASLKLPKVFQGGNVAGIYLIFVALLVVPGILVIGPINGAIAAGVVAGVLATALAVLLYSMAKKRVSAIYPRLVAELDRGRKLAAEAKGWIVENDRLRREQSATRRDTDIQKAQRHAATVKEESEAAREAALAEAESVRSAQLRSITERHETDQAAIEADAKARIAAIEETFQRDSKAWEEQENKWRQEMKNAYDIEWTVIRTRWQTGMGRLEAEMKAIGDVNRRAFPDYGTPPTEWDVPTDSPPGMRFGEFDIALTSIPGGIPRDERLRAIGLTDFTLPAVLPFPRNGSMVVRANREGKAQAVELLQSVMLRYLTSIPPGKVRFTILDPVGLGQNFAAYMHLADYDEQLVTSRIWTEPNHIEQRLTDLTEHMEKVIQKYLRNEFQSIQEYNEHAGEVSEPYRILVVANFPVNISESAAKRLTSILQSGPRCGVYTLLTIDEQVSPPAGCSLADLEANATLFSCREGKILWRDTDFGDRPLRYDPTPDPETITKCLHHVGALARDAGRVEVPFEVIAPAPEEVWTFDSRSMVDVPLGRVGANKLQSMVLGKGTAQHVLVAGRTGSGKSTLLHALITNIALRYSPDEVELYLIDFKKGVEFKTYAAYRLPHARVVSIESEREFGLSVLQRLDEEIKRRGELFRALNVQDLAGYRDAQPDKSLPRIMLIVDEFQEFFVEDDKVAQECALLLDRLVRQGRAFGIHAQLGSQTLGGAFSLARSTLGQMAVRIALQCSESDAHLILSEENSAARLLSRPGEAIYNDANGLLEGNHFFQVVWLSDKKKEAYLQQLYDLDQERNPGVNRPQIVFEGNIPADLSRNVALRQWIESPTPPAVKAPTAWLGDAVAIKDPTAAIFRRQSGAHLLLVGQNDEAARGVITAVVTSLGAQYGPSGISFGILDGTVEDSPDAGQIESFTRNLAQEITVGEWRDTAKIVGDIAAIVDRRLAEDLRGEPPVFLVLYDLARFRDLRKSDDDFGFSRKEEKPSPGKQLGTILKDGPGVGVHVVIWCDSLNNLNRSFDRQTIREFEMRVLFQMSPNDSSTLIDSPLAARLGPRRAFFSSEEQGTLEKFRPYGPPTEQWWTWVRDHLVKRRASDTVIS